MLDGARHHDDPGLPPLPHPERLAQSIEAPRRRRGFLPRDCGEAAALLILMVLGALAVAKAATLALLNEQLLAAIGIVP